MTDRYRGVWPPEEPLAEEINPVKTDFLYPKVKAVIASRNEALREFADASNASQLKIGLHFQFEGEHLLVPRFEWGIEKMTDPDKNAFSKKELAELYAPEILVILKEANQILQRPLIAGYCIWQAIRFEVAKQCGLNLSMTEPQGISQEVARQVIHDINDAMKIVHSCMLKANFSEDSEV